MTQSVQITEAKSVGTKLSPYEAKKLEYLVKIGMYLNVSDFIRDAIREKLEAIQVQKTREITYVEAKKQILGYYRSYKEEYPHAVAENLELDYELVCQVVDELKKEKRLEAVE